MERALSAIPMKRVLLNSSFCSGKVPKGQLCFEVSRASRCNRFKRKQFLTILIRLWILVAMESSVWMPRVSVSPALLCAPASRHRHLVHPARGRRSIAAPGTRDLEGDRWKAINRLARRTRFGYRLLVFDILRPAVGHLVSGAIGQPIAELKHSAFPVWKSLAAFSSLSLCFRCVP